MLKSQHKKLFFKWKKNSKNIYIYMVAELANGDNSHDPGNFGSDQGSVTGYTVTSNNNINRDAPAKPATACVQSGGRRKRRRRRRTRKKRGGGYGFNPQGTPGFGRMPIQVTNTCGVAKDPNLNTSSQFVGSPPAQRGGYGSADLRGTDLIGPRRNRARCFCKLWYCSFWTNNCTLFPSTGHSIGGQSWRCSMWGMRWDSLLRLHRRRHRHNKLRPRNRAMPQTMWGKTPLSSQTAAPP